MKVFQILVPDSTLTSRIIFCENQVTELFVIDRADKKFASDYSAELNKPALYILVNRDRRKLYIGETDDSIKRLRNHQAKDFWTEAIIFHSTTDTLSTTEVKWLESKTYEAINALGYYDLSENKQVPTQPPLKRTQIITLDETFKQVQEYICAAGYDFFFKKELRGNQKIPPTKNKTELIKKDIIKENRILSESQKDILLESAILRNCFEPAQSPTQTQYHMQFLEILDVLRTVSKIYDLKSYNLQVAMRMDNFKQISVRRPERGGEPRKLYPLKIVDGSMYTDVLVNACKQYCYSIE